MKRLPRTLLISPALGSPIRRRFLPLLLTLWTVLLAPSLHAVEHTQTLNLASGWNSVWLEVDPVNESGEPKSVEEVFADPAISYVATPRLPVGTAEFITESAGGVFNQAAWRTWHRSSELGEISLASISGYQAYLVKVTGNTPITLDITGEVRFVQSSWAADSYNLLGFSLTGRITFSEFFEGFTTIHPSNKNFRLAADGNWVNVQGADLMHPGEAYWIYSEGHSIRAYPFLPCRRLR